MRSFRWARWLLAACLSTPPALAGCGAPLASAPLEAGRTLTVVPGLAPAYRPQSALAPYTRASIHHLEIRLFRLDGLGAAETEVPVLDGAGQPVALTVPAATLGQPVTFSRLRANTRYRVRVAAYSGPGSSEAERISTTDALSAVDVAVGNDDAPIVVQLQVRLRDRFVYAGPVGEAQGMPDGASALPSDAGSPQCVYNAGQDEFFVVWRDDRLGHAGLFGRRVSRTGAALGADIRLTTAPQAADAPAVAYNPTAQEYLVVWHEARAAGYDVVGRRVGVDGTLLGGDVLLTSGDATEQFQPRVAFNTVAREYLVVWNESRAGTGLDVVGRRLASDGTPLGADVLIAGTANAQELPVVTFNPNAQEFFVVWAENRGGTTGYDMVARRVSGAGVPLASELVVSASNYLQVQPAVTYNAFRQEYMVVWHEFRTNWDVAGRRVAANGTFPGGDLGLVVNTNAQYQVGISYDPDSRDYLLVYNEYRSGTDWDVVARRVSGTGTAAQTDISVAVGPAPEGQPAIAFHPTARQALVAWQSWSRAGGDLFTSLVGTGATAAQALGASNRAYIDQRSARLVANTAQGGHLLTWLDLDTGAPVVRARRIDAAGTAIGAPFTVAAGTGEKRALAGAFDPATGRTLLVWQAYRGDAGWDLVGHRVASDGTLVGAEFVIASSVYAQEQPAVAFSPEAGEFLVVWQEARGNQATNLVARRVKPDGTLPGAEFVVAASANAQEQAAIAYDPGSRQFLVAWSERGAASGWDLRAQRVASGGVSTGGVIAIATSSAFQEQPSVCFNPHAQEFFVLWQEYRPGSGYDLVARRLGGTGALIGDERLIASGPTAQESPVVTYNATAREYLAVWQDQRPDTGWDVLGARLAADGAPIGAGLTLSAAPLDQIEPRLAYDPVANRWLLAWRDGRASPRGVNFDVYWQAVDSFAGP